MGYYIKTAGADAQPLKGFWWEADKGDAHSFVLPLVKRLIEQDSVRRDNVLRLMRMYGNYSHTGLGRSQEMDPNRLRYNLIAQGCDTLHAEVTLNEPKASYITDGGDWTQKQAAKAREQVTEAQMRQAKWWSEIAPACLFDCLKTGTGIAYGYVDLTKVDVCIERVIPLEIVVDDADARYGNPRGIQRRRLVDREVCARAFPEHGEAIRDRDKVPRFTATDEDAWLLKDAKESDLICIVQSWHLPSGHEAGDGRYVVCCEGLDLYDDTYERDRFPFSVLRFKTCDVGFWGRSAAEELYPDQIELNRTLIKIQEALGRVGGMLLVPREGKIQVKHLTEDQGACIEYSGGLKPEYYVPATVARELYDHCDRVIARALARMGINEMATAGQKPAGLDSGEAIRSYRDQFSMRQNPLAKAYEAFSVDMAALLDQLNRQLYEAISETDEAEKKKMPEFPVFVSRGRKKILKRMRWDEMDLPENRYIIQAFPTSSLPSHPSGRQATVTEWIAGGLLTAEQGKRLLNFPDIEGELALEMVDHDFALFAFETMVEDGKKVAPEPYQNLEMGFELMRRAYLRACIDGVPDSRLQLVRNHMQAIKGLITKSKPTIVPKVTDQLPAPAAPMMAPDGAPLAPELAGVVEPPPIGIAA